MLTTTVTVPLQAGQSVHYLYYVTVPEWVEPVAEALYAYVQQQVPVPLPTLPPAQAQDVTFWIDGPHTHAGEGSYKKLEGTFTAPEAGSYRLSFAYPRLARLDRVVVLRYRVSEG